MNNAFLEHDRRSELRRNADRRNDNFRARYILTAVAVFVLGIYAGMQMEKRNDENLRHYNVESARRAQ